MYSVSIRKKNRAVGNTQEQRTVKKKQQITMFGRRLQDIIRMDLRELRCENMAGIAQGH